MDVITYALSKHYTDDAILGTTGPLKGKPCTISSIESITGGHRVTFLWYDNSGSSHTSFMDVMDGAEVTSIYICHFLVQETFPTKRSNLRLLHLLNWQVGSLPPAHLGSLCRSQHDAIWHHQSPRLGS